MFKNAYPNTAYINLITDDLLLISQIKWRIYGQNFTKQHFEKFLKENRKAIEKLEIGRIEKLLPESMKEGLKQSNMYNRIYNHLLNNYEKIFIN